ncbi:Retrovirus-related Pol polyprotein from transposon opus [Gossypium australe]|uniref:Retrovirus-related Pol polyprotein from transposon opus n=1 Tax=Gossypium australe TaxID=47621 RepID=A0A5B6VCH0_9ROSI|nr:Retrovirus-related Pol polyprotein from transposon opus [Gossypium australe]
MKDPGSFTIHCNIGESYCGKALYDLGSSINLMPMSMFRRLGVDRLLLLQPANRSIAHPEGKIEDVLVHVDKFIFPVDFIILDFEVDKEVPNILGRPFLETNKTLIDVQKGEFTIQVQDKQVTFSVVTPLTHCVVISKVDLSVPTELELNSLNDSLEGTSSNSPNRDEDDECLALLEAKSKGFTY